MRTPRVVLLLAASLLVTAELVSVSLLLNGIAEHRFRNAESALLRATALVPRIAEWVRAEGAKPGSSLAALWIEPFDTLTIEEPDALNLDDAEWRRLSDGELLARNPRSEGVISLMGAIRVEGRLVVFRLSEGSTDSAAVAAEITLVVQHALILLCGLSGFMLAALARAEPARELGLPTLGAYEEAMSRLRARDLERVAAFDREKQALVSVLRDREAMARAGDLTAGIVHEVRNSLGVIAARARMGESSPDGRAQHAAAAISAEVKTLQSVMDRFVDFIRTETVHCVEFDLKEMVARVAARERPNYKAAIEVLGLAVRVQGDEDLLERAIENILRNACQASIGDGTVSLTVGTDRADAVVVVEDFGPGFPDVDRALRPFASTRAGGIGLGLPLALKILTLHHGTLDFAPRLSGVGTQAVCRWPNSGSGATRGNSAAPDG